MKSASLKITISGDGVSDVLINDGRHLMKKKGRDYLTDETFLNSLVLIK